MKIGFFIGNMSSTGGTERLLQRVANALSAKGYEIVVISMWGGKEPVFKLDRKIKRYRLRENYPKGIGNHLKNIVSLYHIVEKEKLTVLVDVDLILVMYSLPVGVLKPRLYRISWEQFNHSYQFSKNHNLRKIARGLSAKCSDALVVLSKEDEMYYRKKMKSAKKLYQIYNPNPWERTVCTETPKKMILGAGRLVDQKGFDLLLESWKLLEADFLDWKLCIAGDGEKREALLDQIRTNGLKNVELLGRVENMEEYYKKCSFFVLPSRHEGFGMVLIEAMGYAKPVVSSTCKSGPREIVRDGKDGYLVPVGDYKEFASKMRLLMESEELRKKMGQNARKSVERFDIDRILVQWEKLFAQADRKARSRGKGEGV